jgi:hypothetical protein
MAAHLPENDYNNRSCTHEHIRQTSLMPKVNVSDLLAGGERE